MPAAEQLVVHLPEKESEAVGSKWEEDNEEVSHWQCAAKTRHHDLRQTSSGNSEYGGRMDVS
jgi:hypothetical protein